jgi:hypothetical protein
MHSRDLSSSMMNRKILRSITLLPTCWLLSDLCGQVVNGSFEDASGFLLAPWSATCSAGPGLPAPGAGDHSVRMEHGNFQGCFPAMITQDLPFAQDGEIYTVMAYVRNAPGNPTDLPVGIRLGVRDAMGQYHFSPGPDNATPKWAILSVTDTLFLGPGDTAVVACVSASIGGPASGAAEFDAVLVLPDPFNGSADPVPPSMRYRISPAGDALYVVFAGPTTGSVGLGDIMGRTLAERTIHEARQVELPISGSGVRVLWLHTRRGSAAIRLTVP